MNISRQAGCLKNKSPLMGPCTTEEALSLIKEEEVLCCCNYIAALRVHVTGDAASFMFQLRGRGTSEQPNL
ncbi:hypothetical protein JOQ06_030182 [Pogonophryne albipinna]|uniref:Uncharacterized protein n=1 Tax=Pogonophryne albipinna TaxID=1090488 RepID=A0AAD6AWI5_9TELE|nr:hypothetical protein JOQ06_030182 [Pogonophryne albipinna]